MNSERAKEVLLLYRPGQDEDKSPEVAEALALAKTDLDLANWLEAQRSFHDAVFKGFESITVPEALKEQIISERKASLGSKIRRKMVLVGSAVAFMVLFFAVFRFSPAEKEDNTFANYRTRMAGKVLREYPRMDLETNDVNVIREYLARNGGQKDYALPAELAKNPATGCAIFPWHGRRVTMICFNSGKPRNPATADLFLFITDQEALENPPVAVNPETNSVSGLKTTSWTSGRKVYLLASAETGQLNQ